jgi:uncharacterized protein (UPF0128 family)
VFAQYSTTDSEGKAYLKIRTKCEYKLFVILLEIAGMLIIKNLSSKRLVVLTKEIDSVALKSSNTLFSFKVD